MLRLWESATLLVVLAAAVQGLLVRHDHPFRPDYILRVTAENYTEACMDRYSVLVNGSLPGPELRLREGETSWIRVYNDMSDANTTIVSTSKLLTKKSSADHINSTGTD
jgi:FtsP/CotA-like multicopper oxidase with cupredoxin domain